MITPIATGLWLVLVALIPIIAAQTEANCTNSQYDWMFNSVGLSPCHVAEQLVQPCNSLGFNIPPLPTGTAYFGPSADQIDKCKCTSVFYSLLSACGACQNRTWITWTSFAKNCTSVWLTVYPNTIPAGVKVPHWAYLDISAGGTFSLDAAMNAGGSESTLPASPASTASSSPSSSSPSSSVPSSASSSSSHSPSSAGPIAGGVVGGVVGVALIAAVAIFFLRREERQNSEQGTGLMNGKDVLSTSPPPTAWNASPLLPVLRPQKLYDSQDPTTFPANMQTTPQSVPQSLTGTSYATIYTEAQGPPLNAMRYTGAPEVYD